MGPAGAYIDSNLLVLLVVGSLDRNLIARHRRSRRFSPDDYDRLLALLQPLDKILVTPNTLTEASNLLSSSRDSRLMACLRALIENGEEIIVSSRVAARNRMFGRLGLTDAALLEVVSAETPLITVDFDLYGAALAKGEGVAVNFTHFRAIPASPDGSPCIRSTFRNAICDLERIWRMIGRAGG